MKNVKKLMLAFISIIAISACNDDDPIAPLPLPINEEELITTIKLESVPVGGGSNVTLTYKDLDGDGPNAPTLTLVGGWVANKTYRNNVTFLNESVTPAVDITSEIIAEGVDHQVFYQSTGTFPNFTYFPSSNSDDLNGKPIGLSTQLIFPAGTSTGNFTITLRHLPNKSAANVATGNITNAGGTTDAELVSSNFIIN